ncbi:MAG TPA: hypothetical protein VFY18_08515, partial [Candidatus Limnocylindrales bacterium]|nr:hypothetical protein [Candidatus Limnocylindrales bacterium]
MTTILRTPRSWPSILLRGDRPTDPLDLAAAQAAGAFVGLRRAVHDLGPAGTIAAIAASGLRGRGGAGFPTAEKWRAAAAVDASRRVVVGNGYGADPSSQTDRTLMELSPYAILEGALIAATAIGADQAIIAVRAESTAAIRALETAIGRLVAAGLAGEDMLGSGHWI